MTLLETLLRPTFGDRLKRQEPLKKYTNFRLGGPADFFVDVRSEDELVQAVAAAAESDVPVCVLGGGSNMLVSDAGYHGLVIKMAMRGIRIEGNTVVAEAGAISAAVARQTAAAGLKGLEWAISLPGTIGGAVRGNAGCFGGEIKDTLVSARVYVDGQFVTLTNKDLHFGYRDSKIKHEGGTVIWATFALQPGNTEELQQLMKTYLEKRKASQPLHAGSAGCVFKNVEVDDGELQPLLAKLDIPVEMQKNHRISAGWIVDQLDLKGTQIGGAKISDEHGNFIVNVGGATASDVAALISLVKIRARNELGLSLHEEVQYLGF